MKLKFDFDERYKNNPNYHEVMGLINSEKNKIGDDFLSSRISSGLSQRDVSDYLDISLVDYIMIESGSSNYDMNVLNSYLEKVVNYKSKFMKGYK